MQFFGVCLYAQSFTQFLKIKSVQTSGKSPFIWLHLDHCIEIWVHNCCLDTVPVPMSLNYFTLQPLSPVYWRYVSAILLYTSISYSHFHYRILCHPPEYSLYSRICGLNRDLLRFHVQLNLRPSTEPCRYKHVRLKNCCNFRGHSEHELDHGGRVRIAETSGCQPYNSTSCQVPAE